MIPFFSIIIPTYNRAEFISMAIDSVIKQTFSDWELLIIDDGSTDNSKIIINNYFDKRIKYIYQENSERSVARNNGIKNSLGKYICFLDSDDKYVEDHLENLFNFILKNDTPEALIFCNAFILNNGDLSKLELPPVSNNLTEYVYINPISPSRACVSHNILNKYCFDKDITIVEDMCLWLSISLDFKILLSNHFGVIYLKHEGNSVNPKNPAALKMYNGLRLYFRKYPDIKKRITIRIYKFYYSNIITNIGVHYILNDQKIRAIFWFLRAIFIYPIHIHTKFRIYMILVCLNLRKNYLVEKYL